MNVTKVKDDTRTAITEEKLKKLIERNDMMSTDCKVIGWRWDFRKIFVASAFDYLEGGFLLRCFIRRFDENDKVEFKTGRYVHIEVDESEDGIVKAMKFAMKSAEER